MFAISCGEVNVLQDPQILSLSRNGLSGFFIAEAKSSPEPLAKHLPQALAEQYACALQLEYVSSVTCAFKTS
jgi:hypothetical protein